MRVNDPTQKQDPMAGGKKMNPTLKDSRNLIVTISWLANDGSNQQIELTEDSHPQQPSRVSGFDLGIDFATDSLEDISSKRHLIEYIHSINRSDKDE